MKASAAAPGLRARLLFASLCWVLAACASAPPPDLPERERIALAQQDLEDDATVGARVAAVRAAQAREEEPRLIDEVELRIGNDYRDEHELRVTGRVPIKRPSELTAQKQVLRAETEMAISRLEESSLERRAELCFPAVEALAAQARSALYVEYARQQRELLDWNADWRDSGLVSELASARFELDSRVKLATWEPTPIEVVPPASFALPEVAVGDGALLRSSELVRETVRDHHPSVALRRASAERYRALAERARARNMPWLKFVELSYEYRTDQKESGVGGRIAVEIPLGRHKASAKRYEALLRESQGEADGIVQQQIARSLQALAEVREFEARTERWKNLLELADAADEIAERWRQQRLAKPADLASLVDEAFVARSAVVEAQERAGTAACTVLAMTGVPVERWPRR